MQTRLLRRWRPKTKAEGVFFTSGPFIQVDVLPDLKDGAFFPKIGNDTLLKLPALLETH